MKLDNSEIEFLKSYEKLEGFLTCIIHLRHKRNLNKNTINQYIITALNESNVFVNDEAIQICKKYIDIEGDND